MDMSAKLRRNRARCFLAGLCAVFVFSASLSIASDSPGSPTGSQDSASAGLQAGRADWNNLKRLGRGDQVRVVLRDSSSYTGEIQAVGDGAITVRTGPAEKTFSRGDVLRVSVKGRSHRRRNALLGLLIGAGAGVAVNVAFPEMGAGRCAQPWPACVDAGSAAAVGLLGGAIGAAAGAAIPTGRWQEVYRAR